MLQSILYFADLHVWGFSVFALTLKGNGDFTPIFQLCDFTTVLFYPYSSTS
jgi:hypothetical protein